ncbi:hypothetical protein ACX0G7_09845 [Flavitalea antarctica]
MSKKTLPPLHLATSDDDLRPALMHIEIIDGIATATNAHIIAQLNLSAYSSLADETIRQLNGKLIHRDVWEQVQDASLITVEGDILHYEKGGIKADFNISCDFKFPDHKSIIDAVANSLFKKQSFVCFNPKFIDIARRIFPSENLIARFYDTHEMMVLFPSGDAKGFVGIMPLEITESEAVINFSLT